MAEINGTENDDTLNGTDQDDVINGLGGADTISGLGGNDTLNGGDGTDTIDGGEGNDVIDGGAPFFGMFEHEFRPNLLTGGPGNDTYFTTGFQVNDGVRFQPDTISELAGEGYDVVLTARSYQLAAGAEIEELKLTQPSSDGVAVYSVGLSGNEFANLIIANAGSQYLIGGAGSDRLYGMAGYDRLEGGPGDDLLDGGEGQDNLAGGEGNDTYFTDGADSLSESAGAGDDTAVASTSFQLFAGVSIETLRTSAPLSTAALALTGNEFGQSIYGNAGNNLLSGMAGVDYLVGIGGDDILDGGQGADYLQGGIGNDQYRVDAAGDVVLEFAGEGDDWVAASVSYTLAAGVDIETLSTTIGTGTDAINLVGNEVGQSIYGNDGNNILNGRGGTDYLVGRKGNDTYILDRSSDVISEIAGEGDDVLLAGTNYALGAGLSIETMVAQDSGLWIELTGNEIGQSIYGNSANNMLDGGGGNDYLVGGGGSDVFAFTTALGAGNVDAIGDFAAGVDRIGIDNAIFTGLDGGALAAGAFRSGAAAQDADDRIIYNPATGALLFDADGNGAGAAIQFAQLQPNLGLTSADFIVI